mgnify:CR=1 FL=1|jgi:hypothetical protein
MTKEKKPYTTYTKDLKLEAIRLMETSDRPATEIAMELDFRSRFHGHPPTAFHYRFHHSISRTPIDCN